MATTTRRPAAVALGLGLVGGLVAVVLGLLTFGAQATVAPDHLPVAVASPAEGPLRTAAEHVATQGGDIVDWRVTTPGEARDLLADKEIYGILDLAAGPDGVTPTVVVSGAVNPQGTQIVQQVLSGAAQGLGGALGQQGVPVAPPTVETVHPTSMAGRTAPLAASALLWVGGLAAAMAFGLLAARRAGVGARLTLVVATSVFAVGAVVGLWRLWDSALDVDARVLGFLLLTAVAFTAVQGALLRLLHLRAAAVLGPLYLIAPAVAGTVPEMLDPVYRAVLWSWTPFRFSTEGLRSLLAGAPDTPDVRLGVIVLASMAVGGLLVLLWPSRRREEPELERERELVAAQPAR
jgi:hypothetical protein